MNTTRILPADVYDALELSALAFGGIGAGSYNEWSDPPSLVAELIGPNCAFGHAWWLEGSDPSTGISISPNAVQNALLHVGIREGTNDSAVGRINKRRHRSVLDRVTFKQWAKELNVVRGDA